MTSLTWNQMTDSLQPHLSIPEISNRMTIAEAALAYAECGWYVIPIVSGTKNPGSYLGSDWQYQSTRDPYQIKDLFKSPNLALALHIGKSGAIAFDVDEPAKLSALLQTELQNRNVPFQSTRLIGDAWRGHYLFSVPKGMCFGNSVGALGKGWGDVRGQNGVLVVSPSTHMETYGHYQWKRIGRLPLLPTSLAIHLPQRSAEFAAGSLSWGEAKDFVTANSGDSYPEYLGIRLAYFRENLPSVNTRHSSMLRFLCAILKDSAVGFYPASEALNQTHALFNVIKPSAEQTPREFECMALWAMAQVESMTVEEKALHVFSISPPRIEDSMEWVRSHE